MKRLLGRFAGHPQEEGKKGKGEREDDEKAEEEDGEIDRPDQMAMRDAPASMKPTEDEQLQFTIAKRPVDEEGTKAYHQNLGIIQATEWAEEGLEQDCKRIGLVTACLHLMRSQADSCTRAAAVQCKEGLRRCLSSAVPEHRHISEEIKKTWKARPWFTASSSAPAKASE